MSQVEKIEQHQDKIRDPEQTDAQSSSESLFSHRYVANDDAKGQSVNIVDENLKVSSWLKLSSLSNFFAGAFIALVAINVTYWLIQNQQDISISEIAIIASVVLGMAWLVSLVIQNNSLIVAYRESEITRLRPDVIAQASRELSREVEVMERQIDAYSHDVKNAVSVIRQESGILDGHFRAGAADIRDVLGHWSDARKDMTSQFGAIKDIIVSAEDSIKASINQFPVAAKQSSDQIVKNFNSKIDDLINRMNAELATDEKFSNLTASLKNIETGIGKLFSDFELQFVEKIDAIKPSLIETAAKTAQDISSAVNLSNQNVNEHLDLVVADLKDSNAVFFEKFPPLLTEFKTDTHQIVKQFSESVSETNRTIVSNIKDEKAHFEEEYKAAMKSLSDFVKEVSKEIKDTTNSLETDFDAFLGKFNFNFIGKLNFFSELVESKTHHFSDRMLEEIDLLKRNFAELANSFSQIIESSMISFDRRSEYMTVEIENHLSGIISKSLANIATRLDLFEEQVSSRINKMNTAIGGDPAMARRHPVQSRFNNDYLSILEQQMNDIHQSLYELKQGSSSLTRK